MRLFPDTSVLLAACASSTGASREVLRLAALHGWELISTPYVVNEVLRNLPEFPATATFEWTSLQKSLLIRDDVFTLDRPTIFNVSKDRPVLYGALAWADVLLTLDRADFGVLMNQSFYGLRVLRPGTFLREQRPIGR